jgi:hypothetical protein
MRRTENLRLYRRTLAPDENHTLQAAFEDKSTFPASLWPAQTTGQREGLGERYLLVARPGTDICEHDRIEWEDKFYRVLWVRAFPKHTEAMLEKEKG